MQNWFSLKKLEIFNWWTFDREVETFYLDKGITVVSGDNWSWKSTLVDALVSLMVPNQTRKYNLSATESGGKKSRNEASYMKWAYKNEETEDWIKTVFLRWNESWSFTYSIILWYFFDESSWKEISLVTFLRNTSTDSIDKFFVISGQELFIKNDFIHILNSDNSSSVSKLKSSLKTKAETKIYDKFAEYMQDFSTIFWLRSNAVELFNKVVSLKEIKDLNSFFRENMLENNPQILIELEGIEKNYLWVKDIYEKIVLSEKKLETLEPFMESKKEYENVWKSLQELSFLEENFAYYTAKIELDLIIEFLKVLEQRVNFSNISRKEIFEKLENLRKEKNEIENLIANSDFAKRLHSIENSLKETNKEKTLRENNANIYTEIVKNLELSFDNSPQSFEENREKITEKNIFLEAEKQEKEDKLFELRNNKKDKEEQKVALEKEVKYLESRQNLLPESLEKIRKEICQNLDLEEQNLPFICELIKIKESEKFWEMAIEKLLHSFWLEMLIPEELLEKVNHYVDTHNLKGKLKYNKIPVETKNTSTHPNYLPKWEEIKQIKTKNILSLQEKLDFKDFSIFSNFVKNALEERFDYICLEKVENKEYYKYPKVLTISWLIKNKNFYLKDDRSFDKRNYILWWNNEDKIKTLKEDLTKIRKNLLKNEERLSVLYKEKLDIENKLKLITKWEIYNHFSLLDFKVLEIEIEKLNSEKKDLLSNNSSIKKYEEQISLLKIEIEKKEQEKTKIEKEIGVLEKEFFDYKNKKETFSKNLWNIDISSIQAIFNNSKYALWEVHLSNIFTIKQEKLTKIRSKKDNFFEVLQTLTSKLNWFSGKYREYKMTDAEKLEAPSSISSKEFYEYLEQEYHKIKDEELYTYREKFEKEFRETLFIRLQDFYTDLENEEYKIKTKIEFINKTLKEVPYSKETYIEINLKNNTKKLDWIEEFKRDFKEKIFYRRELDRVDKVKEFENIKDFMEKMLDNKQAEWKAKVIDVRNWFLFNIKEKFILWDEIKDVFESSSGKSGWQTIKLAYLVLASSLLYQYWVKEESHNLLINNFSKSFRLVVIDEVFAKLDMDNSKYVLDLFGKLDFQLFIITPTNTINVLEEYVNTIYFISNPNWDKSYKNQIDIISRKAIK